MRYLLIDTRRGALPVSDDEALELAHRLRRIDRAPSLGALTCAAIHLEHAVDSPAVEPTVSMNRGENLALCTGIRDWLREASTREVGDRLMNLRAALIAELD